MRHFSAITSLAKRVVFFAVLVVGVFSGLVHAAQPIVLFVPGPITTDEDVNTTVDMTGVFSDPDGHLLTLSVNSVTNPAVSSAFMTGEILNITLLQDQFGHGDIAVVADDGLGGINQVVLVLTVNEVNDAPIVVTSVPGFTMDEDVAASADLSAVFDDVDIVTNGDVLTFTVSNNTHAGLFDGVTISATSTVVTLSLSPAFDANGSADITVRATDLGGLYVEDTFTVTINPVNDIPAAANDTRTINEDAGEILISVLTNDYLAEQPTTITSVTHLGTHTVLDQFDNEVTRANASVSIDGTNLLYEPAPQFNGVDTFTYTIADAQGDTSTGTVVVMVTGFNDPPEGPVFNSYSMNENQTLFVDVASGVLRGAYDVDGALLDENGNPVGVTITAQIQTLPAVGVLNFNPLDGSFDYTPPLDYTGIVSFTYRLFDNESLSVEPAYTAEITIDEVDVVVTVPTPGEVSKTFNLSQTPLEQSGTVPPNVLVLMDDSGSMDFNLIVSDERDSHGGFVISNADIANRRVRESAYYYLWDGLDNEFPASSPYGRIAPTEDALSNDWRTAGNNYAVWRLRTHLYNKTYYNPTVAYEPWPGIDNDGNEFTEALVGAVRIDPRDSSDTFDLLALHSYESYRVPRWHTAGGPARVNVNDLYLPYYYYVEEPIGTSYPATLCDDISPVPPCKMVIENVNPGKIFVGGPKRHDCMAPDDNPNTCTYSQEIQNFANYMQFYRSREYATKAGLSTVIKDARDLRVGFETISSTTSIDIADMNEDHLTGNKKDLLDTVYEFNSQGGTPLRQLLDRGGKILGCQTGGDCPALDQPEGNCQQNFALLFTDGFWTSGAGVSTNTDEDGAGPFDGGRYADDVNATLADVAMEYYENDLFPAVDDDVPIGTRDRNGVVPGTFDGQETMHQHMKTYTIAFGIEGTISEETAEGWNVSTAFPWTDPFDEDIYKIDDLLHTAINGRGEFFEAGNPTELQAVFESAFLEFTQAASSASAAAFNSTSLREDTLLFRGFYDLRDRTGELTATAVGTDGVIASTPVWYASEQLDSIDYDTERVILTYNPDLSDAVAFRYSNLAQVQQNILTLPQVNYLRGDRSNEGVLRERALSGGLLGPIVNSSPVFVGKPRGINRDQVPYPTGSGDLYAEFVAAQNGRRQMVYVGANDGMMHGFDADTGEELLAYVPSMIIDSSKVYANQLQDYTSPFYYHNYFVDLSPSLNDVYMRATPGGDKAWRTVLIGGLGAGGKGFFALDVTDPNLYVDETTAQSVFLWEFTDEDDTYPVGPNGSPVGGAVNALTDPMGDPVKDLGYALALPTVQMTNETDAGGDQEWAAIFGNGANSTSGIATLFVAFLERGIDDWTDSDDFVKISTGFGVPLPGEQLEGYPNALGTPAAVDADLNGTVDYIYAGDRLGNMFRFDLTSDNPDDWEAVRLFQATYDDGVGPAVIQPIQAKPLVVKNPNGLGFMVYFGTGSFISKDDASTNEVQSIYGLWDRLEAAPATAMSGSKASRLIQQTITNIVDDLGAGAITRRIVSRNDVVLVADGESPGVYGWYIDLDMVRATGTLSGASNVDSSGQAPPMPQYPGEKAIRRIVFRDGALITTTVLPATDEFSCSGVRPGSILVMDAFSGGDFEEAVIDFNTDSEIDENDLVAVDGESYSGGVLFNQNDLDGALVDLSTLGGQYDTDFLFVSGGNDTVAYRISDMSGRRTGRLSWLELDESE
ncbi:MAG: PilC/PilY family type IV pilus protein [Pseudomonadota bacterium]|nr:PilC/PilY family type IV pilus protein [Pseudomonadota bacterium]